MSIINLGLLDKKYFFYGKEVYGASVAEKELLKEMIKSADIKNIKMMTIC